MTRVHLLITLMVAFYELASASKEEHVIISNDNSIFTDEGKEVDFGLFGADQVTMELQNLTEVDLYPTFEIELSFDRYRFSSRKSRLWTRTFWFVTKGRTDFNVSAMVNIPRGTLQTFITLPTGLTASNVKKIDFTLRQLDTSNAYCLTSTSNTSNAITTKLHNIGDPVLYRNEGKDRQMFRFQELHDSKAGQYRIFNGLPTGMYFLEVEDPSRNVGSPITAVYKSAIRGDAWHLEAAPSRSRKSVKIRSNLTGTCMSAFNGFGGKIILEDCKYANIYISWKITFCDG